MTPLLIVVTGPPATGKSKVARELARGLRIPLIMKDELKERLYETFGGGDDLEPRIEAGALAILFSVVASQIDAGVSVVAESNFDTRSDTKPFGRLCSERRVRILQIHCTKPPQHVEANFAERAASGRRHPGHEDEPGKAREVRADVEAGRWDALDIPGELVQVDVDELDYDALVERVRALAR